MMALRIGAVMGLLFAAAFGVTSTAHTANLTMATPAKLDIATSTISASVLVTATMCSNRATLTNVLVAPASGTLSGTAASELLLGRSNATRIDAGNGNDCLIGGAAADDLRGQQGTDICQGQGGTDTYTQCESNPT